MAQAYVDGSQSTYVNGEDQGMGKKIQLTV